MLKDGLDEVKTFPVRGKVCGARSSAARMGRRLEQFGAGAPTGAEIIAQ
jgi:hypothetical protein